MRWINGGVPVPPDVVENQLLPAFLRYNDQSPGYGFWAVVEKTSGSFLGWVSFRPTGGSPDVATLGFRFRKAAWGQGYATEAARALIDKGFSELGAKRVVATTYEHNLASRRVMEKLGLKLRRVFRLTPQDLEQADTYHNESLEVWEGEDVEYGLEISEWEQQGSAGKITDRLTMAGEST